jgi:hypothetical protein
VGGWVGGWGGWGGWVGSYPLLSQAPTPVEVELGCDNCRQMSTKCLNKSELRTNVKNTVAVKDKEYLHLIGHKCVWTKPNNS